jgi:dipeptidyl aminopeptidase/acylaminoacyl peptidase
MGAQSMIQQRRRCFTAALLTVSVVLLAQSNSQTLAQTPVPVSALLSQRDFAVLSPLALNGDYVAYTVRQPVRSEPLGWSKRFSSTGVPRQLEGSEVWVANIGTGKSNEISSGHSSAWSPSWSPDGERLAFYSDRGGAVRLWVWDRATNELHLASSVNAHPYWGFEVPRWTSDGSQILIKALPEQVTPAELKLMTGVSAARDTPPNTSEVTATVYADLDPSASNEISGREFGDLVLIDVKSGTAERIARRVNTRGYWISPDSANVAYTTLTPPDVNTQRNRFNVAVVNLRTKKSRILVSGIDMDWGTGVSWSPDGRFLSFITVETDLKTSAPREPGRCYIVSVNDGRVSEAADQPHLDFGHPSRAPVWDRSGAFLYLLTDNALWRVDLTSHKIEQTSMDKGDELLEIMASETGQLILIENRYAILLCRDKITQSESLYRLDVTTGKASAMTEGSLSLGEEAASRFTIAATPDGKRIVYVAEDTQHPPDLWVLDIGSMKSRRLTSINPELETYSFGKSRLLSYRSDDGDALQEALLLPAGYQEGVRYPLIVFVYGGAVLSRDVNEFGFGFGSVDNMQLFSTRGYGILFVDTPLNVGTPMRDIASSVLPGVNKAIDLGIADPDRIGVMGQSYGGYSVLSLLVQSGRFRAAVARGAEGDLIASYGEMAAVGGYPTAIGWAEYGQGRMGGSLWQYPDRYIENSPIFFLDRVKTPLLLIQGETDTTVPPHLAEEVFVGLRRLGKEVVYAKYGGEGHYEGDWSYANRMDYVNRVFNWFDKYLKPTIPPARTQSPAGTPN